jgi:large subunit ribosomal protein L15
MKLNQLCDNFGARKKSKRVGRGIGSGKGKTSGSGVKGQKSRTGVAIKGFEGGQMPIHRRLPKRGFSSLNRVSYQVLNLGAIQDCIERKTVKAGEILTKERLIEAGLIRRPNLPVKLLAKGELKDKVTVHVDAASAVAVQALEKAGGTCHIPEKKKSPAKKAVAA